MKIKSVGVVTALLLCVSLGIRSLAQQSAPSNITGPEQPTSGPGGSTYSHASVAEHTYGEGDLQYWLFEPSDPKPQSAPVVIFNHGWGAMTPEGYQGWINHIVRRGNIVIYPRYQATFRTKPTEFCDNAIHAVKDALSELKTGQDHVQPELDKVAVVGHSAGGNITAGLAARAAASGLPQAKAVMSVEPGKTWGPTHIALEDMKTMPPSTLLLALVGDHDTIVRDIDAVRIINETVNVPGKNKNLVTLVSDDHGQPALQANHFCPAAAADNAGGRGMLRDRIMQRMKEREEQGSGSGGSGGGALSVGQSTRGVNALDYYGTWKLFDALEDAAFYGQEHEFALGDTPQQRYMGKWSDGVAVKELVVEVGHADPNVQRVKIGRPPATPSIGSFRSSGK